MAKNLVIVESPAKAKTIEKYLGKDYQVKASKGHIVDLPKSGLAVDVDKHYALEYAVMPGKQKTIKELKDALKGKEKLIIAVDPDREGEAIGWHVANKLGLVDLKGKRKNPKLGLERIVFTEITKQAVQNALNSPRELDVHLLNSQQARRVLDRLVGYKLSPLLWKKIRFGLSAGRVQSVAVKFVVDREDERNAFKPEEYWKLIAYLEKGKSKKKAEVKIVKSEEEKSEETPSGIRFELVKVEGANPELDKQEKVETILEQIVSADWLISKVDSKQTTRQPKPPFTTSTLQQTAANWFGFSAKRTMSIAQKLYEQGFITYMRTDSTNMAETAIAAAREHIKKNFGADYLPSEAKHYRTKAKVAQEAHEAIRPADFTKEASTLKLEADAQKLYRLIWQRALASQANPARLRALSAEVELQPKSRSFLFRATGQQVEFPGYLAIYPEKVSEAILPDLAVGEELALNELNGTQHFTQPPGRFTEASLIKELEKYGIGRPSTYAPIISTIQGRGYVEKENGSFKPTDTGIVVTRLLAKHFPEVVDQDFTAEMEEDLDRVANGESDWHKVMDQFYKPFSKQLDKKDKEISRDEFTVLGKAPKDIKCPECGSPMIIKLGRYGRFYSCTKFPDCKGMLNIDGTSAEEIEQKASTPEFHESYEPAPTTEDGRDYLLKKGRYGEFWAHPDYPKVKDAQPLVLKPAKLKELYGDAPKTDDGRDFVFRNGKFGPFWAHPDYPKVKQTVRIKQQKPEAANV
jgi:DNA topoisomerase-1